MIRHCNSYRDFWAEWCQKRSSNFGMDCIDVGNCERFFLSLEYPGACWLLRNDCLAGAVSLVYVPSESPRNLMGMFPKS